MSASRDRDAAAPGIAVSIIVPTFRRSVMLRALLVSLRDQMRDDGAGLVDCHVVDNCPERSAEETAAAFAGDPVAPIFYHSEPRPGVANARNTGVAASAGRHILFIDDDELPRPGWLAAYLGGARAGWDAAFGRIEARFERPPEPHGAMLRRLFYRELEAQDGDDVTHLWADLGTGNAMFRRDMLPDPAFDLRFNRGGGEDVFLIKGLRARGATLRWLESGVVEELVPKERMGSDYLARRRFHQGQMRCLLIWRRGGWRAAPELALWMGVGALQSCYYGLRAALARLGGNRDSIWFIKLQGGLGKLMWPRAAGLRYDGG